MSLLKRTGCSIKVVPVHPQWDFPQTLSTSIYQPLIQGPPPKHGLAHTSTSMDCMILLFLSQAPLTMWPNSQVQNLPWTVHTSGHQPGAFTMAPHQTCSTERHSPDWAPLQSPGNGPPARVPSISAHTETLGTCTHPASRQLAKQQGIGNSPRGWSV